MLLKTWDAIPSHCDQIAADLPMKNDSRCIASSHGRTEFLCSRVLRDFALFLIGQILKDEVRDLVIEPNEIP